MLLVLFSIISIFAGYYLLSVSPEASFEEVVRRAQAGMILTIIGGVTVMLYIFGRTK